MVETLERRRVSELEEAALGMSAVGAEVEYGRDQIGTELVEVAPESFKTKVTTYYSDGHIRSKTGEPIADMTARDLQTAKEYATHNPDHAFYIPRSQADHRRIKEIDAALGRGVPDGTTFAAVSSCPDEIADKYPEAVRKRHYRPESKRTLWWFHRWSESTQTVELTSIAIDHKDFESHRKMFERIAEIELPDSLTAEELPLYTAQIPLSDQEFEELEEGLMAWGGVQTKDALEELKQRSSDLVDQTYWRNKAIDSAETIDDLADDVVSVVKQLANQDKEMLAENGINQGALKTVLAGLPITIAEQTTLKRAVLLSAHSTIQLRQQQQNYKLVDSYGGIAADYVEAGRQMGGCSGGLRQLMMNVKTPENWGKDTGSGQCKECKEIVQERGECEVCWDCCIKLELALAA